jgi:hypothetical protein
LFSELHKAAWDAKVELSFIPAKDGLSAYRKAARVRPSAWNILLKDSEEPLVGPVGTVLQKFGLQPPGKDVFWMVQLMEAWFLADPTALAKYYRGGFVRKAIGSTQNVETVQHHEVMSRLKKATANTRKGPYSKVRHAPHLLEQLDPALVKRGAPHCQQLFDAVLAKLALL